MRTSWKTSEKSAASTELSDLSKYLDPFRVLKFPAAERSLSNLLTSLNAKRLNYRWPGGSFPTEWSSRRTLTRTNIIAENFEFIENRKRNFFYNGFLLYCVTIAITPSLSFCSL